MQPLIELSVVEDGTMADKIHLEDVVMNRTNFLKNLEIDAKNAVLVRLLYESEDYCRYMTIDTSFAGDGIVRPSSVVVDGLFTREKNLALMLPLADCVGVVLYDKNQTALGVSHLGRHNLVQCGGTKSVEYFASQFALKPEDILIYLSAAAGKASYPLHDFDGRSLHDVASEQLQAAGVLRESISIDVRDTATDSFLYSHSEFLKDNQEIDGRHALVAMLK